MAAFTLPPVHALWWALRNPDQVEAAVQELGLQGFVNSFRAKSEFRVGLVDLLTTEGGSTWVHQVWTFSGNKNLSKEQVEVTENTAKVVFKVLELLGVDPQSPLTPTTKLPYDSYIYLLKFGSLVKVGGVKIQDKIHIAGRNGQPPMVMDGFKTVYDRFKRHKTSLSLPSEFEGGLQAFQRLVAKDFTLLHLVRGTVENERWVGVQLREVAKLPLCEGFAQFLPCRSHHGQEVGDDGVPRRQAGRRGHEVHERGGGDPREVQESEHEEGRRV